MHEVRGTWFLAGLHSFGDACQGHVRPAVFTALPAYEDWVSSLDWQVYFAEEPEPEEEAPEPEVEAGSCLANSRKCPWVFSAEHTCSRLLSPSGESTLLTHL